MEAINSSIDFDRRMGAEDIEGSRAHAAMLAARGIISESDRDAIHRGLGEIAQEMQRGEFRFSRALEDIHMNIEARLIELIGEPAKRLHTARSRNDQTALDTRLWVRARCDEIDAALGRLIGAFVDQAEAGADLVMPGFTHLQTAQPVTWGHHMLAYAEMFARDRGRFRDARRRMNESPLGAAALAGTSFPIDREMTATMLGFNQPMRNSIDAVSSKDFALEFIAAAVICATNLSRLAEEIVLWASAQFRFVRLSDAFTTGSSIMPQKRNPDAAELVRGKTGRLIGHFAGLATVMKGLALAYSKDMQEDKEAIFDAADTIGLMLAASEGMVRDMEPVAGNLRAAAVLGFSTATDLADWLVRIAGIPFREAHRVTGRIVRLAEERGCGLAELALPDMQAVDARITDEIFDVLSVEASVASRTSEGGTAPARVRSQVGAWRKRLEAP
jgi:argininosuccinate lyase